MASACGSCGSTVWHHAKSWIEQGEIRSRCSECDKTLVGVNRPDVFFSPGRDGNEWNPNIADANGSPIPLTSRAHKAALMKQMGLRESGDAVRGARRFDPIAHRHAEESLKSADRRNHHG